MQHYLVLLHSLTNIKITMYFNYELRFNGVYSKDKLPRTKVGAHIIKSQWQENKRTVAYSSVL